MDSAINGLARQIVEGIPECWGDQIEEGQITINLTIDANIMDELIEEVNRLDMPRCRICGCTDDNACPGGCYWVEEDLCSKCVETDRLQDAAEDMVEALEEALTLLGTHRPPYLGKHLKKMVEAVEKARGISLTSSPLECTGAQQVDIYDLIGETGGASCE